MTWERLRKKNNIQLKPLEATLKCQGVKREKIISYLPPGNQLQFTFLGISPLNFTITPP